MQSSHLEKIFYHYVDVRPELDELVLSRFYDNPEIRIAHDIRKDFRAKYMKAPTAGQMKQIAKIKNVDLSDEKINILYEENLDQYDTDWLETTAEAWIEYKNLDTSVIDLVTYLKTTKVTAENVKDIVQTAKSLISDRNNIDFKFDEGSDFYDPSAHLQRIQDRFSTGYPYLDTVLGGGYSKKTLVAFAGIPKVGKCFISNTLVKVRNKKTGIVQELTIQKFHEIVEHTFLANPANIELIYSKNE